MIGIDSDSLGRLQPEGVFQIRPDPKILFSANLIFVESRISKIGRLPSMDWGLARIEVLCSTGPYSRLISELRPPAS